MTSIPLGTLESFAIVAGTKIGSTGSTTVVTGDIGVSPGNILNGLPPGTLNGTSQLGNAISGQAQTDLTAAYGNALGQTCTSDLTGMDLGGMDLTTGGVYCFDNAATLSMGTKTVTLSGGPSAIYVFKIGTTLTTGSGSTVLLTEGTECKNIFWQVTDSVTLGSGTTFVGNILAQNSITVNGTSGNPTYVDGRLLARTGPVTIAHSTITIANCVICVHEDTLIHTQDGLKAIKYVCAGDFVSDSSDCMIPILKNVHGGYSQNFIKISKDAFATNVPSQDTLISGPHPISLNGKEILPSTLINGTSITQITTDLYVRVYSIVLSKRIPILMNNMLIYSWESEEYEKFCEHHDKRFDFQ